MVHHRYPSGRRVQPKKRRNLFLTAALVAISMSPAAFYASFQGQEPTPAIQVSRPITDPTPGPAQGMTETAAAESDPWSPVDPTPILNPTALALANNMPLAAAFKPLNAPRVVAAIAAPAAPPPEELAQPEQPEPERQIAQSARPVPLPVPRPPEFRFAKAAEPARPEAPRAARAPISPPVQVAAAPIAPADKPSFLEKLFGIKPSAPPENALSYAAVETASIAPSSRFNPFPGDGTAVYDISAKVVIMPNGERLEAHSGLGDKLDDPRFVHVRMKGATPPGTYTLTERETLFHGVRAIRLNPVGGSAAIYGRNGILAHTYMLGPNGDSNGCVSFKDYNRFLQAFLRGEVKRLVVVTGRGDALPRMVNRGRTS